MEKRRKKESACIPTERKENGEEKEEGKCVYRIERKEKIVKGGEKRKCNNPLERNKQRKERTE
jgi:hypothetical protein